MAIFFLTELNTDSRETTAANKSYINLALKTLYLSFLNIIIRGHLNTNLIRNKLKMLQFLLADYLEILMISKIKLDITIPSFLV